jgi:hypothetical protein
MQLILLQQLLSIDNLLSKLATKDNLMLYYLKLNFISVLIAILDFEEQNKKKLY